MTRYDFHTATKEHVRIRTHRRIAAAVAQIRRRYARMKREVTSSAQTEGSE